MTNPTRATDAVTRTWNTHAADGVVTAQEAASILASVKGDGSVTQAEADAAERILDETMAGVEGAMKTVEAAKSSYDALAAREVANAERLAHMDMASAMAELERARQTMQAATDRLDGARADLKRQMGNLEAAMGLRHGIELERRIPSIVDNLSYGVFDWAIFDSEAKAALDQLTFAGKYAHVILRDLALRDGGKYLRRLVDQLPQEGLSKVAAIVSAMDPDTQQQVANALGADAWKRLTSAL